MNSQILKYTLNLKMVVGDWERTFDYLEKVFEEIGKAGKVTEVICYIQGVRRAVNIGRNPEFIAKNFEKYFPPHKQSMIMKIKRLLEKGYLQLYIAPGYPFWHFSLIGKKRYYSKRYILLEGRKASIY